VLLDKGADERESRRNIGSDFCLSALEEMSPLKPEIWLVRALRAEATALSLEDFTFRTDLAPMRVGLSPLNINNCDMLWNWSLLVVCVYCGYVERYLSYYIRQHVDMIATPDKRQHVCYAFRYRDELGVFLFPLAGIPAVNGTNFTLTSNQCDKLLEFDAMETYMNIKYYFGVPNCPGPKLAIADMFVVASHYRLRDIGNFTEILATRDWTLPFSESESTTIRNSLMCRVEMPGLCEDDIEHFNKACPPLPTTPALPRESPPRPKATWKLPWEQFTFRT
jgi:hypothetical protein